MEPLIYAGAVAGALMAVIALWKPVKAIVGFVRRIVRFLSDWEGTPERHDASGAVIEEGEPGVLARLKAVETHSSDNTQRIKIVQQEVKNSHVTNLREDLDDIRDEVKDTSSKLDEHIKIAATESRMLRDLHEHYLPKERAQ